MTTERTIRPTPVQRRVLEWLVKQPGGIGIIGTGHKTTKIGKLKGTDTPACGCSVNVLDGLRNQGWIEDASTGEGGRRRYRITEQGKMAAG